MSRLDLPLLSLLAGIGWGCAFAVLGLALFKGAAIAIDAGVIFAAFGFASGALLVPLRWALEDRLSPARTAPTAPTAPTARRRQGLAASKTTGATSSPRATGRGLATTPLRA